jgi:hypothetical protein
MESSLSTLLFRGESQSAFTTTHTLSTPNFKFRRQNPFSVAPSTVVLERHGRLSRRPRGANPHCCYTLWGHCVFVHVHFVCTLAPVSRHVSKGPLGATHDKRDAIGRQKVCMVHGRALVGNCTLALAQVVDHCHMACKLAQPFGPCFLRCEIATSNMERSLFGAFAAIKTPDWEYGSQSMRARAKQP